MGPPDCTSAAGCRWQSAQPRSCDALRWGCMLRCAGAERCAALERSGALRLAVLLRRREAW